MARCALLYPNIGLDLAVRFSGVDIAWAMDIYGTVIDWMLKANYEGKLPFYGDPSAFPFKLTDDELGCDLWATANGLATTFALKKVAHRDSLPGHVVAWVQELIEVPAILKAWHDTGLFERIDWYSEHLLWHTTPIDERQVYMVGSLKGAGPVSFEVASELPRPKLLLEYMEDAEDGRKWKGPDFLEPTRDHGEATSYIQALRRGAVVDAARSVIQRLYAPGALPSGATLGGRFGRMCKRDGLTVVGRCDDGGAVQLLLDGTPEQFFESWPVNGRLSTEKDLLSIERPYPAEEEKWLPAFTTGTRNVKYLLAALGVPYTYVPM